VLAVAVIEKPGLVATGGADGVIRVMRAADGRVLEEYQNPYGPIWAMAFTAEGRSIYYGGLDDFATLWHVRPRAPFEPLDSPFPRRFQQAGDGDDPIAQGETQFARKCSICHTLTPDGANRAGPTLHCLFGRRIGTLPGYPYSDALKRLDIVWTEETISRLFEIGPDEFTPGSKMPLQKMTDKAQRDALIAFLKIATAPVDGASGVGQGSGSKGGSR
jgi:cytochrome c